MKQNFKDLFENNIYQSFEKNLNFFSYFNITSEDLNNAFLYIEKGYEDPNSLISNVEKNINNMIDYLIHHTKNSEGKYVVPVKNEDLPMSKAYVIGMFFTAIRLLSQEMIYTYKKDYKSLAKIKLPDIDGFSGKYTIKDYNYGLRAYLEGISIWFYRIMENTEEVRDILINHNDYFDKSIFRVYEFRNLFVWVWIWSQLRIVNEFYSFAVSWDETSATWPSIERNCMRPFRYYINDYEKQNYENVKDDIYKLAMWRDDAAMDDYLEAYKMAQSKIKFDDHLNYEDYAKIIDTIAITFNYYGAYFRNGYVDTLAESLMEHHHIVIDNNKLEDIVNSLTTNFSHLKGSDYGYDFYSTGLFHSPLFSFTDENGKAIIVSVPEITALSRVLNDVYDFPNMFTSEKIKESMHDDFKNIILKQIERTDRRYNVRYFKFKNNFKYSVGNAKKDNLVEFDQAIYDIGANYLFFCTNFFFRNEPIMWSDWKNDVKMFSGNNSYSMRFIKRNVIPAIGHKKQISRDFATDDQTKIIFVIFTNVFFSHPSKYEVNGITYYVINYSEMNYFLKTMVFKKDQSYIKFGFDDQEEPETNVKKKHKKKK